MTGRSSARVSAPIPPLIADILEAAENPLLLLRDGVRVAAANEAARRLLGDDALVGAVLADRVRLPPAAAPLRVAAAEAPRHIEGASLPDGQPLALSVTATADPGLSLARLFVDPSGAAGASMGPSSPRALLDAVAELALVLLADSEWRRSVSRALPPLAQAAGASAGGVIELYREHGGRARVIERIDYVDKRVPGPPVSWLVAEPDGLVSAEWVRRLEDGLPFCLSEEELLALADERGDEHGEGALCVLPIYAGGGLWGALLVDRREMHAPFGPAELRPLEVAARLVGTAAVSQRADRALAQSQHRFRLLVDRMREGFSIVDAEGRVTYVNEQLSRMLRRPRAEILGRTMLDLLWDGISSDTRRRLEDEFSKRARGHAVPYELVVNGADGHRLVCIVSPRPIFADDGTFEGAFAVFTDLSAHTETREALEEAVREKDVLVREVHHRVKNSLQVISSLLRLQARRVSEPTARAALLESDSRLTSMALVHETLSESESVSGVALPAYVHRLVRELRRVHAASQAKVEIDFELDPLVLELGTAVSCGLILNELVSNAFEHAFVGRAQGRIRIGLRAAGGGFELAVEDDGVGSPTAAQPDPSSLGLTIVRSLADQLGAELSIQVEPGVRVLLRVPSADTPLRRPPSPP